MKPKTFSKKLNLTKTTITSLEHGQMKEVKGGHGITNPCDSVETNYTYCLICFPTKQSRCIICVC